VKTVDALLADLVAIPSVSRQSNRPVIDYVTRHLDANQWRTEEHTYVDASGVSKTNLIAFPKNAPANHAELTFVCHTDTVPYDPEWTEAIRPALRDGKLYGRGSCDVKGFLSCALSALDRCDVSSLAKPLALLLTSDEEIGCIGSKYIAAREVFHTNYMIIGEPTGLSPVYAGKGYALASIIVRGKEAHSAFPAQGRSAIYDAARVLLSLEELEKDLQRDLHPDFDPPFTTLNVGRIEGGTAKNIIPGECTLTVEWRPIPGQDPLHVARLIEQRLVGIDIRMDVLRTDPPFAPSATHRLVDTLASFSGEAPTTISFGSEAAHLAKLTGETVVFGPGDMTVAHKTGEFVPLAELEQCVLCLEKAIAAFCA
jgi:acetylornithine deacetylase